MINRSFKFGAGIIIIPLINFFFSPFKGDLIYAEEIIERKEIEFTNSVSSKINQKKNKSSFIENEVSKIDNSKFLINKNPYKLNQTLFLNHHYHTTPSDYPFGQSLKHPLQILLIV